MKAMRALNHRQCIGLFVSGWLLVQAPAAFSADLPKADATAPGNAEVVQAKASLSPAALKKLDAQIVLALKKSRGEPPFDKPTSLQPDIPIQDGANVLVDLDATVSDDLQTQIRLLGGKVANSPDPAHIIRAMVPLSHLETLAGRADVRSISPAILTIKTVIKAAPAGVKLGP